MKSFHTLLLSSLFTLCGVLAAADNEQLGIENSEKTAEQGTIGSVVRIPASAMNPEKLNFLYESDPTLLTSSIQIVVLSGSSQDPLAKTGLSNLLGELQIRGTKTKSRSAFQSELERLGGTISVNTDHDSIVMTGTVIKENTMALLKLIEECVLQPGLSEEEFKTLKAEVLADISFTKNSNYRLASLALRRQIFAGTALERPSYGGLKTVQGTTLADVSAHYKKVWVRGNVVFGMVSPLSESDVKPAIEKIWKALPAGPRLVANSITPKIPAKPELVLVHKAGTSTGALVFGQKGITAQDKFRYALGVGNFSFGAEPLVSRLFRVVRSQLGYTYSVGSSYGLLGGLSFQQGVYSMSSTPSVEFTSKTLMKTLELWDEYLKTGLNPEELGLAHESLVNSYPFEFDSAGKRLVQRMNSFLYEVPLLSPEEYKKTIEAVGNAEVLQALKDRQAADQWAIVLVADSGVITKQLAAEQKKTAADKRIKIAKKLTPEQVID